MIYRKDQPERPVTQKKEETVAAVPVNEDLKEEKKEETEKVGTEEVNIPPAWAQFEQKYPHFANTFLIAFQEQLELLASKMLDYGTDNIKAGTQLETEEDVRFVLTGLWFRINDKVQRWKNMLFTETTPNHEALYDTFMDIANYAVMAKLVSRGIWN